MYRYIYIKFKMFKLKIFFSLVIVMYIWTLPVLSKIGFAEKNEISISGFISNAQATGAMSVLSYSPINLISEYQLDMVDNLNDEDIKNILLFTLSTFKMCYGLFLICTYHYVPYYVHFLVTFGFCLSFIIHSFFFLKYLKPSIITSIILKIGIFSFILMPFCFNSGLFLWFIECIGLTCLFLFTPVELILMDNDFEENHSYYESYNKL
jgi:hypothetical protein